MSPWATCCVSWGWRKFTHWHRALCPLLWLGWCLSPLSVPQLFLKEGAGRRLQILGARCHSRGETSLQHTRLSILLRVKKCGIFTCIWRAGSAPRGVHRQGRTQLQACQSSWSLGYVLKLMVGFLGLSYTGPGVELISLCGTLPTWDILWFDDIRGLGQYHLSGL